MHLSPVRIRPPHRYAIEGYAALFNHPDLSNDIIAPGAFSRSLAEKGVHSIKLLLHHDPKRPVGVWDEMREDHRGLYVRG
ncbi:MAG: hypothetical protein RL291_1781, partial [Pseudomonadota bacterium]